MQHLLVMERVLNCLLILLGPFFYLFLKTNVDADYDLELLNLNVRVIGVQGTTSMGFQILITAKTLFEKILQDGCSGCLKLSVFKIFVLILQEGIIFLPEDFNFQYG